MYVRFFGLFGPIRLKIQIFLVIIIELCLCRQHMKNQVDQFHPVRKFLYGYGVVQIEKSSAL